MKPSEKKKKLVEELAKFSKSLDVVQLYHLPRQDVTQNWLANMAAVLKNLDEGDYQEFVKLSKVITPTEKNRETRKKAAYEIKALIKRKVAEYKKYDFSYLDREISIEEKKEAIDVLQKRGVKKICPMCGNKHFILANAYFSNTLQSEFRKISLGGPNVPTIPIICSNCGFVSQHALGILGLLPRKRDKEKDKKDG